MSKQSKHKSSIYEYLDSSRVLEAGKEEDIAQARKKYWSVYKAAWRRDKRRKEKELTTSWTKEEFKSISTEAQRHHQSKTGFIKASVLAYMDKRYIVPNQLEIRKIAQLLAMAYNSILEMTNENALHLQTGKMILEKIFELERAVLVSLHHPKTLEQLIAEAIGKTPQLKENLIRFIEEITGHDSEKP